MDAGSTTPGSSKELAKRHAATVTFLHIYEHPVQVYDYTHSNAAFQNFLHCHSTNAANSDMVNLL